MPKLRYNDGTGFKQIVPTKEEFDGHKAESASKHIKESGTNENGSYIKFDDGTIIMTMKATGALGSTEINITSLVLPASIINGSGVGSVSGIGLYVGTSIATFRNIETYQLIPSTTTCRLVVTTTDVASDRHMVVSVLVIGRWK